MTTPHLLIDVLRLLFSIGALATIPLMLKGFMEFINGRVQMLGFTLTLTSNVENAQVAQMHQYFSVFASATSIGLARTLWAAIAFSSCVAVALILGVVNAYL